MKRIKNFALVALVAAGTSCGLDIGDLNNPGIEDLLKNPSAAEVGAAATGLLVGTRLNFAVPNGYVSMLGILGRESYNLDAADPRFITEMLGPSVQLDPGSPAFGGNFWAQPYRNIRNAQYLMAALDVVQGMTDEQKQATRGFAKTIQAMDYLIVINTRDSNGAVIVKSLEIGVLDDIVSKDMVMAFIATELDEAKTSLAAGGMKFPFPLSSGFDGFDTPADFIKFNRALKARVDIYRKDYQAALTDLGESFITADAASPKLDLGVYHVFGSGSGDSLNGLVSANLFAHPSIVTDADKNGMTIDDRVTRKIKDVAARTVQGVTSDKAFKIYTDVTTPVPMIRNEELILIRAEANIGLGNIAAAADDLNFIRVQSGKLAPRNDITADNAIDELLKQRRYSLLFEGGHRWIDTRRLGKQDTLPLDQPTHHLHDAFPIPVQETDARK